MLRVVAASRGPCVRGLLEALIRAYAPRGLDDASLRDALRRAAALHAPHHELRLVARLLADRLAHARSGSPGDAGADPLPSSA